MKVKFNLRDRKREIAPIHLIYNVKGKRLVFPTGEKIPIEHWSVSQMKAKKSLGAEASKINYRLRMLRKLVNDIEIDCYKKGKVPTKGFLRRRLREELEVVNAGIDDSVNGSFVDDNNTPNFNEYINAFIARREQDPSFAEGTIRVYESFRNHWNAYCKNGTYDFDELSVQVLEGFKLYLINHEYGYSDNLVDKMIRTSKVILNDATERGYNSNMDYKSKISSHSPKPADNIYLSNPELKKIEELDLSDHPQMEMHRDLFIIGAYTGLRYSDFCRIGKENITTITDKNDQPVRVIKIFMKKVNNYVYIPLHPTVDRILKNHDYNLKQYEVRNAVINRHLKLIGEEAEIDDYVTKVVYRSNKGVKTTHKKYELITTHTARRSFATNAYKAGVPMLNIMRITGHKTSRSFLKYIRFDDEENAVLMAGHEFFQKS